MDILEIKEKRTLSREEAAKVLHRIADSLERHNELQFTREGKGLHVKVPDAVELEVELEIESDETSLEIELNW
ncbi:amphi-Trp domain-containing protein [Pseudohalioglobus lutimaris]|uniref:Amphi-Trp domain-containing protein n=1 Tax=Pseudohalioglobus lutimaris TaxID=1737061 RepID=A0A2N5X114_9GAMM|nr:amphi-Trp domain-containing protein [Pseudohalioglobus lutimaris]PLW68185.1 amphi-Trp domain-containing protein [Pseudohalioglobus lutimaris]